MAESKIKLLQIIDQLKEKFPEIRDDDFFEFNPVYSKGIIPV